MINFANFELGVHDNMSEISGNVIGLMADMFEVNLSENPTVEELGRLVGRLGPQKELQANIANAKGWMIDKLASEEQAIAQAVAWVGLSGVQERLDRSIWSPTLKGTMDTPIVITGGVANWQDRTARMLAERGADGSVFIAAGNRVMESPTEITNPNVEHFKLETGEYPMESSYVEAVVSPLLENVGYEVVLSRYNTGNGDDIANRFLTDNQDLLDGRIIFARVANAGLQLAGQMRSAAQVLDPHFDNDPSDPNAYALTDAFPIAKTQEQLKDPANFQNPFSAMRQVAITAKTILEMQCR